MFGQLIFADIPFADHVWMPRLDDGWHVVNKDDCTLPGWDNQPKQDCDFTVIDEARNKLEPCFMNYKEIVDAAKGRIRTNTTMSWLAPCRRSPKSLRARSITLRTGDQSVRAQIWLERDQ